MMLKKRFISLLCIFLFTQSFLYSVPAARRIRRPEPSAELTPQTATLIINEYLADPPAGVAGDANGDGTRDSAQDEFIELVNNGASPLNIGLFTISDSTATRFTFPSGKVVPP